MQQMPACSQLLLLTVLLEHASTHATGHYQATQALRATRWLQQATADKTMNSPDSSNTQGSTIVPPSMPGSNSTTTSFDSGQCLEYIHSECLCHHGCAIQGNPKLDPRNGKGAVCFAPLAALSAGVTPKSTLILPANYVDQDLNTSQPSPHCAALNLLGGGDQAGGDRSLGSAGVPGGTGNLHIMLCVNADEEDTVAAGASYSATLKTNPSATTRRGTNTLATILWHHHQCTGSSTGLFKKLEHEHCHQTHIQGQAHGHARAQALGGRVSEGEHVELPPGELFKPDSCKLHSYGVREMAGRLQAKLGAKRFVLMGDSLMRQLFMRLVSSARGDPHVVDFIQWNHSRYSLYDAHDRLEIRSGAPHQLSAWWEEPDASGDQHVESPLLEVIFVWAPRFNDVRREVQEMTESYAKGSVLAVEPEGVEGD
eukprot:gene30816-35852_t